VVHHGALQNGAPTSQLLSNHFGTEVFAVHPEKRHMTTPRLTPWFFTKAIFSCWLAGIMAGEDARAELCTGLLLAIDRIKKTQPGKQ
jgi:hypothetical protein